MLVAARHNILRDNSALENGDFEHNIFAGIGLIADSSGNELDGNLSSGNADEGFILEASSSNTLTRNGARAARETSGAITASG